MNFRGPIGTWCGRVAGVLAQLSTMVDRAWT